MEKAAVAVTEGGEGMIARTRPLLYSYEKEIVLYAHYLKLKYFSTECPYNPMAYRGNLRSIIKDLEKVNSKVIHDILHSGVMLKVKEQVKKSEKTVCTKCGFASSHKLCKTCTILEKLKAGMAEIALS